MAFHQPNILWALFALAIPLIIHLFNFRRHRIVLFSNVRMLKEVETQSKKARQLRKWLILLSRLVAFASLIIAFAQPYIPDSGADTSGAQTPLVYLDNSLSMSALGSEGSLFESARKQARELIKSLPAGTQLLLINNDRSQTQLLDAESALDKLSRMKISRRPNRLSYQLHRAEIWRKQEGLSPYKAFVFSDLQTESKGYDLDSSLQLLCVQQQPAEQANVSIDSVWLDQPLQSAEDEVNLQLRLINHGDKGVRDIPLILEVAGQPQGSKVVDLRAGQAMDVEMSFGSLITDWVDGQLRIEEAPFAFDNSYNICLDLNQEMEVLELRTNARSLAPLYDNERISFRSSEPLALDPEQLQTADLIILNALVELSPSLTAQLREYLQDGGRVMHIPSAVDNRISFAPLGSVLDGGVPIDPSGLRNDFFSSGYEQIPDQPILPEVKRYYRLQAGGQLLLTFRNGEALLKSVAIGKGELIQWAVPLDDSWSEIPSSELFGLSALRALFNGGSSEKLAFELYENAAFSLQGKEAELPVKLRSEKNEFVLEGGQSGGSVRLVLGEIIDSEGHYELVDARDEFLGRIALNTARSESSLQYYSLDELPEQWKAARVEFGKGIADIQRWAEGSSGLELWKRFVLLSLIFVLIEILLLRFLRS